MNTAAGGQSSGEISYAITSGTGEASIDPTTGEITGVIKPGTLVVTATKAGDENYYAGASLSDALLTGGQASVPGSFVWSDPHAIVSASGAYTVHFVPEDTDNYETVTDIQVQVRITGEEPVLKGDLDGDGKVSITDVMQACKVLARKNMGDKPNADEIARGDLNGDRDVSIEDIMAICKILARQA